MKKFLAENSPGLVAFFIRALASTLRFRLEDPQGLLQEEPEKPRIFVFWHNRILMMSYIYERFCVGRKCLVLISRSRDGEFISSVGSRFGLETARGSSSTCTEPVSLAIERHGNASQRWSSRCDESQGASALW